MLKANNTSSTCKQANKKEFKISLMTYTLLNISTNPLKNAFENGYSNKINANKELFLRFDNYIIYNIFWPYKPSIIFTYLNSFS